MLKKFRKICEIFFGLYSEDAHIVIKFLGIKFRFKNFLIDRVETMCAIRNIAELKEKNVDLPHPIGIVIHPATKIGRNVRIFQNVTLGAAKYNPKIGSGAPIIEDNVVIFASALVIGGVVVGKNSIIGAGAVVVKDVPPNSVVVGNPARVVRQIDPVAN